VYVEFVIRNCDTLLLGGVLSKMLFLLFLSLIITIIFKEVFFCFMDTLICNLSMHHHKAFILWLRVLVKC
jgi:hypothetical protein